MIKVAHHYYEFYRDLLNESDSEKHCVMVGMPKFKQLVEFINSIPDENVFLPENKEYGKETKPHITVLWGVLPESEEKAKNLLSRIPGKLVATLGKVSLFENCNDPEVGDFDVLKIDVQSPHLTRVNEALRKTVKFENDYDGYHPHVTLAYLKPGKGKQYVGNKTFEGLKFLFEVFTYSNSERQHETIPMLNEYLVGQSGGYGTAAGGQLAANGWAATPNAPSTSGRMGKYPENRRSSYMQGNTVVNNSLYDTIRPEDLKHPKFSPDEIMAGLRWEMKRMEYPDKDRAKPRVLANLAKNPKFYSDLDMYQITGK
jgi:hypothetical protein